MPFLLLMYILGFLNRTNISFAKEALQASAHVSDTAYALGAGLFFLSYAAFEVPSNFALHRLGARIWMARIMVTWGIISAAMIFARGEWSFYLLRLRYWRADRGGILPGCDPLPHLLVSEPVTNRDVGIVLSSGAPLASKHSWRFRCPATYWSSMALAILRAGNGYSSLKDYWRWFIRPLGILVVPRRSAVRCGHGYPRTKRPRCPSPLRKRTKRGSRRGQPHSAPSSRMCGSCISSQSISSSK